MEPKTLTSILLAFIAAEGYGTFKVWQKVYQIERMIH